MSDSSAQFRTVLFCFAVREEARFFKSSLSAPIKCATCITGIGRQNAAKAVVAQVDRLRPKQVFTCGFAGGLNPQLARSTIVFSADDELSLSSTLLELGAMPVRFHCAERVAVTAAEKRALWLKTGADAVEMESEIIRQFCRERGIHSATIRVISDSAEEDLPLDFNALMTPNQNLSYLRLAAALVRSPQKVSRLLELQRRTTAAARQLGACLNGLLERQLW